MRTTFVSRDFCLFSCHSKNPWEWGWMRIWIFYLKKRNLTSTTSYCTLSNFFRFAILFTTFTAIFRWWIVTQTISILVSFAACCRAGGPCCPITIPTVNFICRTWTSVFIRYMTRIENKQTFVSSPILYLRESIYLIQY